MFWKKLDEKALRRICCSSDEDVGLLENLIARYNFTSYCIYPSSVPLMTFLQNEEFTSYRLSISDMVWFYGKYRTDRHTNLDYLFWGHALGFKDANNKVFVVLNPYLTDDEISSSLDVAISSGNHGGMGYDILGKAASYWNPGKTNLVVLYYMR